MNLTRLKIRYSRVIHRTIAVCQVPTTLLFVIAGIGIGFLPAGDAQALNVLKICKQGQAHLAGQAAEMEAHSPALAKTLRILADEAICSCTEASLRSSEFSMHANTEQAVLQFFRANTDCLITHLHHSFPPSCPEIYRDLLPAMGYGNPSDDFVQQACACVIDSMKEHANADAVYHYRVQTFRRNSAKNTSRPSENSIQISADPLSVALSGAKACVAGIAPQQ